MTKKDNDKTTTMTKKTMTKKDDYDKNHDYEKKELKKRHMTIAK